jgi:hypothetical protein
MATVVPWPEHTYEIRVDQLEVTMGGWFGGQPDVTRRFVPGLRHYLVDGVEVDQATYETSCASMSVGPTYRSE